MADPRPLLGPLRALHERIRDAVVAACAAAEGAQMADVHSDGAGDTIYRVDRVSEEILVEGLAEIARDEPLLLLAEGLPTGGIALPAGTDPENCRWRVMVDPIDGTRGIMYQKRSAWVLTGVAPNRGDATRLADITLAVQTEIPVVKQTLCDQLWAVRGQGMEAVRIDRISGARSPIFPRPSRAESLEHGYATVVRFFPGARDALAALDDEIVYAVIGDPGDGKAACFEDQYACTGGQLHELIAGRDRFIADLRPLTEGVRRRRGLSRGLYCHPYDLCTVLVAEEAGVIVTGAGGDPLDAPLDLDSEVAWIGYANAALRTRVEPVLQAALRRRAAEWSLPPSLLVPDVVRDGA